MTHVPSRILRQLLIDANLASGGGAVWPAFYTGEGDLPDKCIVLTDTVGVVDDEDMHGNIDEHYGFQLMVRSAVPDDGWLKIDALRQYLAGSVYDTWVTVGASAYVVHALAKLSAVNSLGKDRPNSNRSMFTVNGLASIKEKL